MTTQESRNAAIIALAKAYEQNQTHTISRIESILLPESHPLPKPLQDILDSWGTSPIAEPKMYKVIQEGTLDEAAEAAVKGANMDEYSALDISVLTNRVVRKISDKIDADGMYKSTPAISGMPLPKVSQIKALKAIALSGLTGQELEDALDDAFFKTAGLEKDKLSVWEQDLVKEIMMGYIQASENDLMGKFSDRTPFARYLKN